MATDRTTKDEKGDYLVWYVLNNVSHVPRSIPALVGIRLEETVSGDVGLDRVRHEPFSRRRRSGLLV